MAQQGQKRKSGIALLICAGMLMLHSACESVLFIELEESEKLIVVNGAISSDSLVSVQVSRTRHVLDNAPLVPLENAGVRLYSGGALVERLDYAGNAVYRSVGFRPSAGREYVIEVENPGYPAVTARSVIPEPVRIAALDTFTAVVDLGTPYYSHTMKILQIDLTIEDPPGVENYYMVDAEGDLSRTEWYDTTVIYVDSLYHNGEWHYYVSDSTYQLSKIVRYADNISVGSTDLIVEAVTSEGILFSDQLIDGKKYSMRLETMTGNLGSADSALFSVRLHSISESYYRYLQSRQKHYETRDNYLAVPVIVYSNIESGTGFFGGFSTDVTTITTFIPEFEGEYWYYESY
jgi:hypothetical protein